MRRSGATLMIKYIITAIVIFAILDAIFIFACIRVSDDIGTRRVSIPDETKNEIKESR